jgi:exopolyphosphatase / guanosine-5'-triphosphate,3'-diphosphate pyrophosphatase
VIFDLAERRVAAQDPAHARDMRDASVRELQRRFMVDAQQAANVANLAERFYARVRPPTGNGLADDELRRELRWAAALHETGMMVSHHDHHRHSAYVLDHVDAAGFSQSQLRRVGELVLGQRGGLRKIETSLTREDFVWQLLCLRLAIIKCHARGEVSPDAMRLKRDGPAAELGFPAGWAETHPRTRHLLDEEMAMWGRSGPLRVELRL